MENQQYYPQAGMQQPNYGAPQMQQQYNPQMMQQQAPAGYGMQQAPAQAGMVQNNQYAQKPQSTVVEVIRSNYTTIALFEVSGGYDPAQQFPKALCFVMGVPGVKDPTKQSGRRYEQSQKIVMKFSTQEIRSLGQSLINIATFKQAASAFEKHSDPSKNSYSQNNGQQQNTKKLKASFDQGRSNIVITMNYGQGNVMVPVPLQDAFGLGHDLINIGNFSDAKLAEYKIAHKIGKEEITGIDYDPAGAEETPVQQGYAPQGQPGQSVGQMQYQTPVYNPAMGQPMPQMQQAPAGYPGSVPGMQGMPGQH